MDKNEVLMGYVELVEHSDVSEPLCLYLQDDYYWLVEDFKNYLIKEKILDSTWESIYGMHFLDDHHYSANTFRIMVLEDFLNKYNK